MSLRKLPNIKAQKPPEVFSFEYSDEALQKWDADISAKDSGSGNVINILDGIGVDPWTGEGVSSNYIAAEIDRIGPRDIVVNLNSFGGDFFEGVAIYNMLRMHKHKITVNILSLAASAASIIAMSGDEILIGKSCDIMVHNAWSVVVGNRHDLRAAIDVVEPFDRAMAAVYADRSGQDEKTASEWMDNETWFTGEEAIKAGLADGYLPSDMKVKTQSKQPAQINAVRQLDSICAKAGIPRSKRRSLIGEVKSGMHDAARTATHDAGEIIAAIEELRQSIK